MLECTDQLYIISGDLRQERGKVPHTCRGRRREHTPPRVAEDRKSAGYSELTRVSSLECPRQQGGPLAGHVT